MNHTCSKLTLEILTPEDAVEDDFHVSGQQVGIVQGGQGQITGHVPTQLLVVTAQKVDHYRNGHRHHFSLAVVLKPNKDTLCTTNQLIQRLMMNDDNFYMISNSEYVLIQKLTGFTQLC